MTTALYKTDIYQISDILRQWYPWNYGQPETGWAEYIGVPAENVEYLGSSLRQNPYFSPGIDSRWTGTDQDTLSWALTQVLQWNPSPYSSIWQAFGLLSSVYHDPPSGQIFVGDPILMSESWAPSYDLIALGYGPGAGGRITYKLEGICKREYSKAIIPLGSTSVVPIIGALLALSPLLMMAGVGIQGGSSAGRRRRKS